MEWQPIETAPKDDTLVDLWWYGERLTDYRYVDDGHAPPYWQPTYAGPMVVRDATHWLRLTAPPPSEPITGSD